MLVLTRKVFETVHVGEDIVITVCSIAGDRVKLGIQAPASLSVDRGEVRNRKRAGQPPKGPGEEKEGGTDGGDA